MEIFGFLLDFLFSRKAAKAQIGRHLGFGSSVALDYRSNWNGHGTGYIRPLITDMVPMAIQMKYIELTKHQTVVSIESYCSYLLI